MENNDTGNRAHFNSACNINTFPESYDLTGKTIIPFATVGSSGIGKTNEALQPSCPNSRLIEGSVLNHATRESKTAWVDSLDP